MTCLPGSGRDAAGDETSCWAGLRRPRADAFGSCASEGPGDRSRWCDQDLPRRAFFAAELNALPPVAMRPVWARRAPENHADKPPGLLSNPKCI